MDETQFYGVPCFDVPARVPRAASQTAVPPDALTLAGFAAFVVLAAANGVAIRFTVREMPPFWGAGIRFAAAALVFIGFVLARRLPLPRGRALAGALLFGALQFGIGFALIYFALLKVPAGLGTTVLASIPLFTLLFAFAAGLEPLRLRGALGALVAIAGIAVMFGGRTGKDIPALYLLAAVGGAACFALAAVVVKSYPQLHPAVMNAVAMSFGSAMLLGLSLVHGEVAALPRDLATWTAWLYLVLPGSVGVFALILFLLRRWTASGVSYQGVLSPLVGIVLAWLLLGEPLTSGLLLAAALILAGVYLGALAPERSGG